MDSLLRWSIENSSPSTGPVQPRKDLDPAIIDHILGKPDAVLMKEALAIAVDEKKSEDERVEALDNLEMVSRVLCNCEAMLMPRTVWKACRAYRQCQW
jgi:hsp70-interacting protein